MSSFYQAHQSTVIFTNSLNHFFSPVWYSLNFDPLELRALGKVSTWREESLSTWNVAGQRGGVADHCAGLTKRS